MGLDIVEVVMRCEETFAITIPDDEAAQATTVGKLYETICRQLNLPPDRPSGTGVTHLHAPPRTPWTPEDVWATLVLLVVDQLQVPAEDVRYDASWQSDLGAD